jgi:putative transposase
VELDWLKKNLACSLEDKRVMIDPNGDSPHSHISIERQCELIGLSRSSYYYQGKGEDEYNLLLMPLIDAQYTRKPYPPGKPHLASELI